MVVKYNDLDTMIFKWEGLGKKGKIKMKEFVYVTEREAKKVKKELIELINLVQDEVRNQFTFRYDFIGSASRNMITYDKNGNTGYDFDVNLRVNDDEEEYSAKEIKDILRAGFDKHVKRFKYDFTEDSSRVITIKVKDTKNSKILHSCDFAIVYDCEDGRQQYIRYNKNQSSYTWEYQPKGFYRLPERIELIKENSLWNELRDLYLENKNKNNNPKKKSRSIFAESVNQIVNNYELEDDLYEEDDYE